VRSQPSARIYQFAPNRNVMRHILDFVVAANTRSASYGSRGDLSFPISLSCRRGIIESLLDLRPSFNSISQAINYVFARKFLSRITRLIRRRFSDSKRCALMGSSSSLVYVNAINRYISTARKKQQSRRYTIAALSPTACPEAASRVAG